MKKCECSVFLLNPQSKLHFIFRSNIMKLPDNNICTWNKNHNSIFYPHEHWELQVKMYKLSPENTNLITTTSEQNSSLSTLNTQLSEFLSKFTENCASRKSQNPSRFYYVNFNYKISLQKKKKYSKIYHFNKL